MVELKKNSQKTLSKIKKLYKEHMKTIPNEEAQTFKDEYLKFGFEQTPKDKVSVNFKNLSEVGLIWKINKEILHPLNLALSWNPLLNISFGCIKGDEPFEFSNESNEIHEKKYNEYIKKIKELQLAQDLKQFTHIYDWIESPNTKETTIGEIKTKEFLDFRTTSALYQMENKDLEPKGLCTCLYKQKEYKITGASRLGDVWLATDFERKNGYDLRVSIDDCSEFKYKE